MAKLLWLVIVAFLASAVAATDVGACGSLSSADTYVLNQSISIDGVNCINITANNVFLDCNGSSITGNNTTDTYGIYSTKLNTTIKNCNISNFHHGVYFYNADNGLIDNVTASTSSALGMGILISTFANGNTVNNSRGTSTGGSGSGIRVDLVSVNNTINNSVGNSTMANGIIIGGEYNTVRNSVAETSLAYGLAIYSSFNTVFDTAIRGTGAASVGLEMWNTANGINITNVVATAPLPFYFSNTHSNIILNSTATSTNDSALWLTSNADNNTFVNCTFESEYDDVIAVGTSASSNVFINNKIISNTRDLVSLVTSASANTFCLNNFTNTSGYYVRDLNGTNSFNCTYDGKIQGNIWADIMNGSIAYTGTVVSSHPSLFIADAGASLPYNSSVSARVVGIQDWHPLTSSNNTTVANTSTVDYTIIGWGFYDLQGIGFNYTVLGLGSASSALIILGPTGFTVTRPLDWHLTYTQPGDPVGVNWTNSTSPILHVVNYTATVYTEAGVLVTVLTANTSGLNDTWVTTALADGFYFVNVTACDLTVGLCTSNISAVFGVYNTSITVGFGTSATAAGGTVSTANFTEYCQHLFYPTGTQYETGADVNKSPSGILYREVYNPSPPVSAANAPYVFANVTVGAYTRTCYAINIYNETGRGPTWGVILTPPIIPPYSGGATTNLPVNSVEAILLIVFLILMIFLSTMFSEIKVLGVFGAMLMVLLGIWVSTTGIYYKSGEVNAGNNTIITSVSNTTNTTTISTYVNSTILNTYDTVQVPGVSVIGVPGAEAKTIIGIVVIGLGLFALIYYSRIFTRWK